MICLDDTLIFIGPCKEHPIRKYRKQEAHIVQQQQEIRFVAFKLKHLQPFFIFNGMTCLKHSLTRYIDLNNVVLTFREISKGRKRLC